MANGKIKKRKDLLDLTAGEKLWALRRMRKQTQAEAARYYKISERRYNEWETGRRDDSLFLNSIVVPVITVGMRCALARRRDGRPLRELARVLRAGSHVTLLAWEREGDPRLVRQWERRGYRF